MIIKGSYDSAADVPQDFKDSYTEKDGKFVLTGNIETKESTDYKELNVAKKSAFDDMHGLKNQLKEYDGIDPAKQKGLLDELDTLRVKVKGGEGDKDQKEILEAMRLRDREADANTIKDLTTQLSEANGFKTQTQKDKLLDEYLKEHVSVDAIDDATFRFNLATDLIDGKLLSNGSHGFDKGLDIEALTAKALSTKAHWQKKSTAGHGTGANGAQEPSGDNTPLTMKQIVDEAHSNN